MSEYYVHVVITSEEEQSTKMVYSSKKEGIIKVQYIDDSDDVFEYDNFTQEELLKHVIEHQDDGYFITSYIPSGSGRGHKPGINLNSTIIMAKKVNK